MGCSVIASQFFGAKDYANLKTSVYTALAASAVLCGLLMVFGLLSCETLLRMMRTQPEILADSALYLDIYILGLPFLFFYNLATGIFSALGDSRTPFLFLAFSSTANIIVDFVFVKYCAMGIAGVAWATLLCQGISCVCSVLLVFRRLSMIRTESKAALFSWRLLKKLSVIAIPSILQQSFVSIGNILIQGRINSYGVSVSAGYAAAVKLNNPLLLRLATGSPILRRRISVQISPHASRKASGPGSSLYGRCVFRLSCCICCSERICCFCFWIFLRLKRCIPDSSFCRF